jgi:NADH-quinone oxidoreductase subunit G
MPSFKLDDHEIPFEPGDTILRAAHRVGIDIPHYCWHPGLSVAANCRMCLVEVLPPPGRPALMLDVLRYDEESGAYIKEQKPKLVPACQQPASDGMQVRSQSSAHVARARAAVQELLLLNHPVDCPICDQAGECRLQDYWLSTARNKKRMRDEPVHKPKAVIFGPTIVYDAERCIVCTRCVRVCTELARDPVLSVRERGNLNEIVLSPGRQLDHKYTLMTEYVCPVGALTARDFRFKARVWFLRSARSICVGCATGCNNFIDYDPRQQKVYRYRPRENQDVNRYWMCDHGMLDYQRIHTGRVLKARIGKKSVPMERALEQAAAALRDAPSGSAAAVLSAQHSSEDNFALLRLAQELGITSVHVSGRPAGDADGILIHSDRNPNTAGVERVCGKVLGRPASGFAQLLEAVEAGRYRLLLVLGSHALQPDRADVFGRKSMKVVMLATHVADLADFADILLPCSSWAEAQGTFVNARGLEQTVDQAILPRGASLPAWQLVGQLARRLDQRLRFDTLRDLRRALQGESPDGPAPAQAHQPGASQ